MRLALRNPLVALGLSGVLAVGVVGAAGVALAQESPTPEASPTEVTPAQDPTEEGMRIERHGLLGLGAIIEASGLDRQVFIDGFEAGQTVAQVLEANGLDPNTIKAEVLADAEEALDSIMDSTPDLPLGGPHVRIHIVGAGLEELAGLLGMTKDELAEAFRDGQTVAEIAEANGVDVQPVIDGLVTAAGEKLAEAVANGRFTQEQADEILAGLEERINTFVNEGGPFGFHNGGRRGFREERFSGGFPGRFFGGDTGDSEPEETGSSITS